MRAAALLLVFTVTMQFTPAHADYKTASAYVPDAQRVGKARLKYLLWDVYDAELFAPAGKWHPGKPFALTLYYLRDFSGKDISERSIAEIRKQGFRDSTKLAAWRRNMDAIFPNVSKSAFITGIRDRRGYTVFYKNRKRIGTIKDPEFTKRFFDIWLGRKASDPGFRNRLLGASK